MRAAAPDIVLYHDVVEVDFESSGRPGAGTARYKLTREEFAKHLDQITKRTPSPAITLTNTTSVTQTPPFLLTIDDGGSSALYVADQLEQHNWRGHFLITTDYIDPHSPDKCVI